VQLTPLITRLMGGFAWHLPKISCGISTQAFAGTAAGSHSSPRPSKAAVLELAAESLIWSYIHNIHR